MSEENNEVVKTEDKTIEKVDSKENETNTKKNSLFSIVSNMSKKTKKFLGKVAVVVLLALFVVVGFYWGSKNSIEGEDKAGSLSFKDVGNLVTQEAYITVIGSIDKNRKIYSFEIPLTQSICIFSVDVQITAGYDFTQIVPEITKPTETENGKIVIKLPTAKTMYYGLVPKSHKIYYDKESIFTNLDATDLFGKENELVNNALTMAVKNGLLVKAKENAKTVLTGFIKGFIGDEPYDIEFVDVEETYY